MEQDIYIAGRLDGTLATFSAILQNKSRGGRYYARAIANALKYAAASASHDANWAGVFVLHNTFPVCVGPLS